MFKFPFRIGKDQDTKDQDTLESLEDKTVQDVETLQTTELAEIEKTEEQLQREVALPGSELQAEYIDDGKLCKVLENNRRRNEEATSKLGTLNPELYRAQTFNMSPQIAQETGFGELQLKIWYDFQKSDLMLNIAAAKDLVLHSINGNGETYVRVMLEPAIDKKIRQTAIIKQTKNPEFNAQFKFGIALDDVPTHHLLLEIFENSHFGKPIAIGNADINLEELDVSFLTEVHAALNNPDAITGEIQLALNYLRSAQRMTVTVNQARNLKNMDLTGSSDPYVRVIFTTNNKQQTKKTNVVENCANPVWNEAFIYDVAHNDLQGAKLELVVVDYDLIGFDDVIGSVTFASTGVDEPEKDIWTRLINSGKCESTWHKIKALATENDNILLNALSRISSMM